MKYNDPVAQAKRDADKAAGLCPDKSLLGKIEAGAEVAVEAVEHAVEEIVDETEKLLGFKDEPAPVAATAEVTAAPEAAAAEPAPAA